MSYRGYMLPEVKFLHFIKELIVFISLLNIQKLLKYLNCFKIIYLQMLLVKIAQVQPAAIVVAYP